MGHLLCLLHQRMKIKENMVALPYLVLNLSCLQRGLQLCYFGLQTRGSGRESFSCLLHLGLFGLDLLPHGLHAFSAHPLLHFSSFCIASQILPFTGADVVHKQRYDLLPNHLHTLDGLQHILQLGHLCN